MKMLKWLVLLAVVVCGIGGQNAPQEASTVAPEDIFSLSEEDFQLWISGRQPKAWGGSGEGAGSNTVGTTTTPRTTAASVFRTTSTTPSPSTASTTAAPQATTPNPLEFFTVGSPPESDGKSWFEGEEDATLRPDVLGDQFRPAGEDFAQWLDRQMNKVQEVTFTPQTTLTGDQFPGLVTRLTTVRNRIPTPTTFAPSAADAVTLPPPPAPSPASTSFAPLPQLEPISPIVPSTTFGGQPANGGGQQPVDLQKWLRDQLQLSQSLTDRLLAQWSPSGAFIRTDGHRYTPSAVSYQTSALIHGFQGVSHTGHIRNEPPLPFPGTSHSTDSYLSHQKPAVQPAPTPVAPVVPIRRLQPTAAPVFFPAPGSYYYSAPSVPFVGHYRAPVVINYH
ncbi:mucin-2-like [Anopheles ziemanni]|uniref:mucin-2-like n=1 Tax=Anopheles coustani TaxID=139045 RepID=UPI002657C0DC|nr:mucin-2-like [Anopheles coustani]XP_058178652.1 mucin-2-like [Anopheles ziemanni]